jgi:two-component system, sensor histidine kinase
MNSVSAAAGARATGDEPMRVMVVDDRKDMSDSMAIMLNLSGYAVQAAYDGASALALAQEFRPQAIVIDLVMPRMDGLELARCFRADPATQNAILVAITGGPEELEGAAADAGFDHFIAKPASLVRLLQAFGESFTAHRRGAGHTAAEPTE